MNDRFDPSLLEALGGVVTQRTGLRFIPERYADLERGVRSAARELGFATSDACAAWLVSSMPTNAQIRMLAAHLTVGETYFFREKAAFEFLERTLLPDLIASRRGHDRRLRIWSAGCCTGEEPYSLAISLSRILPDPTGWQIHILGTDINEQFLNVAREATYGEWSFRDTPAAAMDRWFVRTDSGRRRLVPEVARHVTFAPLNLIDDVYPSQENNTERMDIILCRNVLIYMNGEQSEQIVRNFSRSLGDGGLLLVGAADGSLVKHENLAPAEIAGLMAFRKTNGAVVVPPRRGFCTFVQPVEPAPPTASVVTVQNNARLEAARRSARTSAADNMTRAVARAETAYAEGRYADVIVELLPLCSVPHPSATAAAILARAYANQGKQSDALTWCERAIRVEKLNPRLYYLKASILQEQGEMIEAAAVFRRVLYLDADFVMAHVAAGHLARRLGKLKECDRYLHTARRLLDHYAPEQPVPEAEGIDARQLARLIAADAMNGAPHAC